MTRYDTEIDAQTWAFIRETESYYSTDMVGQTIARQRQEYDDMCRAFTCGNPQGLDIETTAWESVPVRIYQPDAPIGTLLYYHGGGYVVGGLDSHDSICAELADRSGLRVVSVDYRLAPEHLHPAQFDDAIAALRIAADLYPAPLIVAGDSAGGNLAAAVAHRARDLNIELAGQILIYPSLGTNMDEGSYIEHANAPLLSRDDILYYRDIRCENGVPKNDPTFAPLDDSDFTNLPPTVIITAACDPLADDGKQYQAAITDAGGKAHWVNEAGLVHGYLRARNTVDRAKQSFDRIVSAATTMVKGQWPY
jgi:acetyl esterase